MRAVCVDTEKKSILICETITSTESSQVSELEKQIETLENTLRHNASKYQIGALTQGIVHGFKNDLMILTGSLECLNKLLSDEKAKTNDYTKVNSFIQNCLDVAQRIDYKTTNILKYSKSMKSEKINLNISSFLDSQINLYELGKGYWNFKRDYKKSTLTDVNCNPSAISYAIGAIIENATEASPKHSEIRIDAIQIPKMTKIRIKDSGKGMSEDVQKRIFEIGYTYNKENGNGIGLAFSKQYLRDNGCDLFFNSKEGKGTTFYIEIPNEKQ